MLRSILAVIASIVIGLTVANLIERLGIALQSGSTTPPSMLESSMTYAEQLVFMVAWSVGAFAAALSALLLGRRWGALGIVSAATFLFQTIASLVYYPFSWWAWPLSIGFVVLSGSVPVRLLGDFTVHKKAEKKGSLF